MNQETDRYLKDLKEAVKKNGKLNQLLKKQQELGSKLDDKNKAKKLVK